MSNLTLLLVKTVFDLCKIKNKIWGTECVYEGSKQEPEEGGMGGCSMNSNAPAQGK